MPFSNDEVIIEDEKSKFKSLLLIICIGLFVVSLFNTSYCTDQDGCGDSWGAFLIGWLGMLAGGASLTWLANPLIFISWILIFKNKRGAWTFALLATLVSLSFLTFHSIIANEAGHYYTIIKVGIGYWLWVISCTITFIGSFIMKIRKYPKKKIS